MDEVGWLVGLLGIVQHWNPCSRASVLERRAWIWQMQRSDDSGRFLQRHGKGSLFFIEECEFFVSRAPHSFFMFYLKTEIKIIGSLWFIVIFRLHTILCRQSTKYQQVVVLIFDKTFLRTWLFYNSSQTSINCKKLITSYK